MVTDARLVFKLEFTCAGLGYIQGNRMVLVWLRFRILFRLNASEI